MTCLSYITEKICFEFHLYIPWTYVAKKQFTLKLLAILSFPCQKFGGETSALVILYPPRGSVHTRIFQTLHHLLPVQKLRSKNSVLGAQNSAKQSGLGCVLTHSRRNFFQSITESYLVFLKKGPETSLCLLQIGQQKLRPTVLCIILLRKQINEISR